MAWALDYLSRDKDGQPHAHPVTRENLLSAVVYTLTGAYSASITGIDCDQWCLITAATYGYNPAEDDGFATAIQCDDAEDGIAFTLKAFYDHYGPGRPA
jgi:hypothetical protein